MRGIITADWHIRAIRPRCRTDEDWILSQKLALKQIEDISHKFDCNVYCVGDLFHSNSTTSFECIKMVQDFSNRLCSFGKTLGILAGNHDLPYHSSGNLDKSAIGILLESYNVNHILDSVQDESQSDVSASNFDEEDDREARLVFKHILVFPDVKSIPEGCEGITAKELLNEFPKAEWIFTGDNHHNFHYEKNGRHVVNPGCLMRQVSDMKEYQCGVYYVDTDKNICEFIPIIDNVGFVDDSYILQENERNERIESFVEKLRKTKSVSLDFVSNVENELRRNDFDSELSDVILELLGV